MGETDSTEQSPQGEVNSNCNGALETGGDTESGENPQQEQLIELSSSNGDARRGQDPALGACLASLSGSRSPFRDPSVRIALICVSGVAVFLFFVVIALVAALAGVLSRAPVACPNGWVAFQGQCYYFSVTEGNWTYSRSNCSALGTSLAGIDTQQDMDFMLRYRGHRDHWLGLQKDTNQLWRWVNGTEFNSWFHIGGGGECAYLKEAKAISSSRCSMERHWICSKPHVCVNV
nr:C-type lectin domain family 2 member D-like isoform X1 [Chrysemys picta bellii]XP_042701263.1 C-type lectin domain family 2 member D-like isoform X1 [Chrysemys picta bellii]XP_042701264.1 C-type lectin domain family 2 member D-like isoform X1 [Chrysemys picta bellii]XP_042701265.1 C-type lectin domain family 2 member D-like isoform X1 [Chrysemys picta bellii]